MQVEGKTASSSEVAESVWWKRVDLCVDILRKKPPGARRNIPKAKAAGPGRQKVR